VARSKPNGILQVKEGSAGNLPLKMLSDMSNNLRPLFHEWRSRIQNMNLGLHLPQSEAAGMHPVSGVDAQGASDVGKAGAAVRAASTHVGSSGPFGFSRAGVGAPVQISRGQGSGVVLSVSVAAPTSSTWGVWKDGQALVSGGRADVKKQGPLGKQVTNSRELQLTGEGSTGSQEPAGPADASIGPAWELGIAAIDNISCDGVMHPRLLHHGTPPKFGPGNDTARRRPVSG
jgi:hypothetical protein